jgi:hypothetical protein
VGNNSGWGACTKHLCSIVDKKHSDEKRLENIKNRTTIGMTDSGKMTVVLTF